jgi:hypothetical protein
VILDASATQSVGGVTLKAIENNNHIFVDQTATLTAIGIAFIGGKVSAAHERM